MENLSFIVFRYFWPLHYWAFKVRMLFLCSRYVCVCVCVSYRIFSKIALGILINSISSGVFIHSFWLNMKFMVFHWKFIFSNAHHFPMLHKHTEKKRTSTNSQRCVREKKLIAIPAKYQESTVHLH